MSLLIVHTIFRSFRSKTINFAKRSDFHFSIFHFSVSRDESIVGIGYGGRKVNSLEQKTRRIEKKDEKVIKTNIGKKRF